MCEKDVIVQEFKTSRGGIKLYLNGFTFEKNKELHGVYHWVCEMRRNDIYNCKSCLNTVLDAKGNHILKRLVENHNHGPDPTRKEIADVKAKIKEEAALGKLPERILATTAASTSVEVLESMPSTAALKQMIYRKKKNKSDKNLEPIDINTEINEEFTKICEQNFIIKDKVFDANKRIIIMSTMNMMMNLSNSSYWILDGSFRMLVSSIFKYYFTIHGNVFMDSKRTFPLLFCLSTHKDRSTYDVMFELIKEYGLENKINIAPSVIISHFDDAAISSLSSSFDNVIVEGTNYHFGQIIYRQVCEHKLETKFGTDTNFNRDVKCLLALRYLDQSEIQATYKQYFEKLEDSDTKKIAKWFYETYINGVNDNAPMYPSSFWCCYKTGSMKIPKTHDAAEAWHHKLNRFIDKHCPNVYDIIKTLIKETNTNCDQIEVILSGNAAKRRKRYSDKNELIESILEDRNSYTSVSLLKAIATNIKL